MSKKSEELFEKQLDKLISEIESALEGKSFPEDADFPYLFGALSGLSMAKASWMEASK